jgi:hypothetical protein
MKTRFSIYKEIFVDNAGLEKAYECYEKHYRKDGWILDKTEEEVYFEINKEVNLCKGDNVVFKGWRTIVDKEYEVLDDTMVYRLEEI